MKTLMILGGSGYLGKSFLQYFIDGKLKKYNVKKIILLSRNINKLKKIFNIKSKNVILRKIDLMIYDIFCRLFSDIGNSF